MKGTANIPLENIAQLSQASHILILFSIGFSVGCVIGYKNVFLWTLWCSDIFDFSCHLHGNVVASKAASRSHSKWESLVLISPLFSVGDGANDVSMIQVADTGVGILGQEGMQVVYTKTAASDIRIHFKSVQLTLEAQWLHSPLLYPGGAQFASWAHTHASALIRSTQKLRLQGFKLQTAELAVWTPHHSFHAMPKHQWFLWSCVVIIKTDSLIRAHVVLGWAVCISVKCGTEGLRSEWG